MSNTSSNPVDELSENDPIHDENSIIAQCTDTSKELVEELSHFVDDTDDVGRTTLSKSIFIRKKPESVSANETSENECLVGDCGSRKHSENKNRKEDGQFSKSSAEMIKNEDGKLTDDDDDVMVIMAPLTVKKTNRERCVKVSERTVIEKLAGSGDLYELSNGTKKRSKKFSRVSHDEVPDVRRIKLSEKGTMTDTSLEPSFEALLFKTNNAEREYALKRAPKVTSFLTSSRNSQHSFGNDSSFTWETEPMLEVVCAPKNRPGWHPCFVPVFEPDGHVRNKSDPYMRKKFVEKAKEFCKKSGVNVIHEVLPSSVANEIAQKGKSSSENVAVINFSVAGITILGSLSVR